MTDIAQPVTIIDSHVHFWRIGGPGQTWPGPDLRALCRDFGPPELLEALSIATASAAPHSNSTVQVQSVVLVQSQPDDRDTDWLLGLAALLDSGDRYCDWLQTSMRAALAQGIGLQSLFRDAASRFYGLS